MGELIKNNNTYKLKPHPSSTWITVEKNGNFLAMSPTKTAIYQAVYMDIKSEVGECEFITEADFE